MSELVEEERFDIFVSYADADRAWVEGYLLDGLQSASLSTIAQHDFRPGVPALLEFERAVKESRYTLLVISTAWLATNNSSFIEVLAQTWGTETNSWPVIPLLLEDVPLPPRLAMLVPIDMRLAEEQETALVRLCRYLKSPSPGNSQPPPCPYPGMVAFSEDTSDYFFGREQEIETLTQKLRHYPFICIIGASGSGKSSLVFAGLLPALRKSNLIAQGEWQIVTIRPGQQPIANLHERLQQAQLSRDYGSTPLMLVVDQFEELFTSSAEEVNQFVEALANFYQQPNCFLILTVRADFFSELMKSNLWHEIQAHRLELGGLDEKNLRAAIEKPAETVGVYVEGALVERLLVGVGQEPGALPILQEIMVRLWQRLERRLLPLRAYESLILSYKQDGLSTLQALLAQFADEIVALLPQPQQQIARRIFVRLVQFGEGRADTRRQQSIADLRVAGEEEAEFEQTLSHLVNRRLLTISSDSRGNRLVDIAHEKMLERWPTLQAWIREHQTTEQNRRRLEAKAAEWRRLGSQPEQLFLSGALIEALDWMNNAQANALGYSSDLSEMVAQSEQLYQCQIVEARRQQQRTRLLQLLAALFLSIIVFALFNFGRNWWLNRSWRQVTEAPTGALSTLISAENQWIIGSYDSGVAWRNADESWSKWENLGLPTTIAAQSSITPSNFSQVVALSKDKIADGQLYALVKDRGIYLYPASSLDPDLRKWRAVGGDVPLNSEAYQPLAVYNNVILYIGNDLGLYIGQVDAINNTVVWLPATESNAPTQDVFKVVLFDKHGTPYLGGETGILRGEGDFPWRWQRLGDFKYVTHLAHSEDDLLYVVTQVARRATIYCYNLRDANNQFDRLAPIANWFIYWLGVDRRPVHAIVGNPVRAGEFYLATSHGAVYAMDCAGMSRKIAQKPLTISFSSLATTVDKYGVVHLAWANQAGLYEWIKE